ncbi:hypothetical protein K431DRAFT_35897 [Polychaeton citri CBS 116435]|uniref:Uncharacterized protein n=1 Tax=Polychaeton citri CBS 116435 TaxID=1314669 RepID=A0A9P4UQI2_9PEZI|nr:hypothetical protein K431DRAFT_35897 [Polychaeton citri CBS 116435]
MNRNDALVRAAAGSKSESSQSSRASTLSWLDLIRDLKPHATLMQRRHRERWGVSSPTVAAAHCVIGHYSLSNRPIPSHPIPSRLQPFLLAADKGAARKPHQPEMPPAEACRTLCQRHIRAVVCPLAWELSSTFGSRSGTHAPHPSKQDHHSVRGDDRLVSVG